MAWTYLAERLDGNGGAVPLENDLPLQNVSITQTLSGPDMVTGEIGPEVARLVGSDGAPVLAGDWSTALYAIESSQIMAGVIIDTPTFNGATMSVEGGGFGGYPYDQPYTDSGAWVKIDAFDAFRKVWEHLQGKPGGNLGLQIDTAMSGIKIGTELKQVEFDTINGPVSFESGPFRLAWYQTSDLGNVIDELVRETPFDWRERHQFNGDNIEHFIDLGYPRLGRRRDDLRFVYGENIAVPPSITDHGDEYANEILQLGAGEGSAMLRGSASAPRKGLRRVKVLTDKKLRSLTSVNTMAKRHLAQAQNIRDISTITLFDHPHAELGSVQVGDEIYVEGRLDWVDLGLWCRVVGRTFSPDDATSETLTVIRTDRMQS